MSRAPLRMQNLHALLAFTLTSLLVGCRGDEPGEARGGPAPADVATPREGPSGKELSRDPDPRFVRYLWHDGDAEHEVWLDPALLVDHRPDRAQPEAARAALAGAEPEELDGGRARLYRLPQGGPDAPRLAAQLAADGGADRWSPAFRSAPSQRGALRLLPGGVIVTFDASWTAAAVEAWAAERGLTCTARMDLGLPACLVATPPGLAALERAEQLHALPETRSALPDWWSPVEPK